MIAAGVNDRLKVDLGQEIPERGLWPDADADRRSHCGWRAESLQRWPEGLMNQPVQRGRFWTR